MAITQISRDWGTDPAIVRMSSSDTLATVIAANYITDKASDIEALNNGPFKWLTSDTVLVYASDGWGLYNISSDFSSLESFITAGAIDLASGTLLVGNASGVAQARTISGDITVNNTGVAAIAADVIVNADIKSDAAIAYSKLAALTDGNLLVGSAANVATSVALSGDATIVNSGAITLGTVVNAAKAATYAPEAVIAGMPVLHVFNMAGGATATRAIATAQKITVVDAWALNKGAGSASDTVQVKNNAGTAITNAFDMNVADESVVRAGTIDDAERVVNAGDNLSVTITDGGGSDVPAIDVYVLCYVTP